MKWRRRRGASRDYYDTPWLLREYYGAPVWGIILTSVFLAGIAALGFLHH